MWETREQPRPAQDVAPILEVRNLHVAYFSATGTATPAIADVSFELRPGEILGVLPESGSGKRTVAFSLLSPSGERKNPTRLGMQVQVVPLEFRSLFDRLMQTKQYDGCVAGLASFDADPNSYIKVWLSSRPTHFWNPSQAHPARPW